MRFASHLGYAAIGLVALALGGDSPARAGATETDIPGVFAVGSWTGQCFRDGYLAGRKHEDCGAILEGAVKIWLFRTVKGMEITLSPKPCTARPWTGRVTAARLNGKDAASRIETQIAKGVQRLQKKCGSGLTASAVMTSDLEEIITLTDGLEF